MDKTRLLCAIFAEVVEVYHFPPLSPLGFWVVWAATAVVGGAIIFMLVWHLRRRGRHGNRR
ncbi:MAG: hypothetical protein ACT4QC_00280 [Planctomycetaceae bacterium]